MCAAVYVKEVRILRRCNTAALSTWPKQRQEWSSSPLITMEEASQLKISSTEWAEAISLRDELKYSHFILPPSDTSMRRCRVNKVISDAGVSYIMTEERTNAFLLSCVATSAANSPFIFTMVQDIYTEQLSESACTHENDMYVGSMVRGRSELDFVVKDAKNQEICLIRFDTSNSIRSPVSFSAFLAPPAAPHLSLPHAGIYSTYYSAIQARTNTFARWNARLASFFAYNQLPSADTHDIDTTLCRTRPPQWNSEYKSWLLNFGGRAKVPSQFNFMLEQDTSDTLILDNSAEKDPIVLIYCKVADVSYLVDYRAPMSVMSALAIVVVVIH